MTDLVREREGYLVRREARMLTLLGRQVLSEAPPAATRAQIEEAAVRLWPVLQQDDEGTKKRKARKRAQAVRRATELQREALMGVDTQAVRRFIKDLLIEDPGMDYGEINRAANERFQARLGRAQTSALASAALKELKADPSKVARPSSEGSSNVVEKEEPPEPPQTVTEVVAGAAVGSIDQSIQVMPASPNGDTPLPDIQIGRSRHAGCMDVHVALIGVPAAVALRLGAALAQACELELREA